MTSPIPLTKPYMTEAIKARVCAVLDSGYLTEGSVTRELEACLRDYLQVRHALAVTSCTTGLEVALRALNIGPGDEVILPDYTFPATAHAVALTGARPVIVDVEKDTLLISPAAVEQALNPRTKALLPVSLFGNPLGYSWISALKQKHSLYIVEDAACALGAEWQGAKVGSLADISVFSLHPRKFITTGEGGIITTNNDAWAAWMRSYTHFGTEQAKTERESTQFVRMGTNYKLSNVQAAIGLGQMQDIDMLLAERRALAQSYTERVTRHPRIQLPSTSAGGKHSWQTFCIFVENSAAVVQKVRQQGIEVQIGTYSLHQQPVFQQPECRLCGNFSGSAHAFAHTLALPLYHGMTEAEQEQVVQSILTCLL